jgi:hypothetical protein
MLSNDQSRKRRVMIITADEGLIEQIQKNNSTSLFQSIVIDSKDDSIALPMIPVGLAARPIDHVQS